MRIILRQKKKTSEPTITSTKYEFPRPLFFQETPVQLKNCYFQRYWLNNCSIVYDSSSIIYTPKTKQDIWDLKRSVFFLSVEAAWRWVVLANHTRNMQSARSKITFHLWCICYRKNITCLGPAGCFLVPVRCYHSKIKSGQLRAWPNFIRFLVSRFKSILASLD